MNRNEKNQIVHNSDHSNIYGFLIGFFSDSVCESQGVGDPGGMDVVTSQEISEYNFINRPFKNVTRWLTCTSTQNFKLE